MIFLMRRLKKRRDSRASNTMKRYVCAIGIITYAELVTEQEKRDNERSVKKRERKRRARRKHKTMRQ